MSNELEEIHYLDYPMDNCSIEDAKRMEHVCNLPSAIELHLGDEGMFSTSGIIFQ